MRLLTDEWLSVAGIMADFWWRWLNYKTEEERLANDARRFWRETANGETGGFD